MMLPRKDLSGKIYGYYTVLGFAGRDKGNRAEWLCKCKCGNKRVVNGHKLTSGHSQSCGCYKIERMKEGNFTDIVGKKYGLLTVVSHAGQDKFTHHLWKCSCECGGDTIVDTGSLNSGKTKSCGCRAVCIKVHADSGSDEYSAWRSMQSRCYNNKMKWFHRYGGRGITVCDRWLESYDNFLLDMGRKPTPKHSLDRIDNDGDYSPANCRWANQKVQTNNTCRTILLTAGGITKTLMEWSESSGIIHGTIRSRLRLGWSIEDAVSIKPMKH